MYWVVYCIAMYGCMAVLDVLRCIAALLYTGRGTGQVRCIGFYTAIHHKSNTARSTAHRAHIRLRTRARYAAETREEATALTLRLQRPAMQPPSGAPRQRRPAASAASACERRGDVQRC